MAKSGWYKPAGGIVWHFHADDPPSRALCGDPPPATGAKPRGGGATWAAPPLRDCSECRRKVDARGPQRVADALLPDVAEL